MRVFFSEATKISRLIKTPEDYYLLFGVDDMGFRGKEGMVMNEKGRKEENETRN